MDGSLIRNPVTGAPASVLRDADGWLVCLRAGHQFRHEYSDNWDEAIDLYDNGWMGWYATGIYACRNGMPQLHLTYADIQSMRRS
jgi:hypothetical protein